MSRRVRLLDQVTQDRFWSLADISGADDCWPWLGRHDRDGYGAFYFDGRGRGAHRAAFILTHGPIPPGMTVDHLCFKPDCVNPAHLRLLTPEENSARQRTATAPSCIHGHDFTPENTYARLSDGKRQCRACNRDAVARYRRRAA